MSHHVTRRLRLHLFTRYSHLQCLSNRRCFTRTARLHPTQDTTRDVTNDYKRRVAQLEEARGSLKECYPRLDDKNKSTWTTIPEFKTAYKGLMRPNETREQYTAVVAGTSIMLRQHAMVEQRAGIDVRILQAASNLSAQQETNSSSSTSSKAIIPCRLSARKINSILSPPPPRMPQLHPTSLLHAPSTRETGTQ